MKLLRRTAAMTPSLLFVAVLMLPAAQTLSGFAPARPLAGVVASAPEPAPHTLAGWHSGALQAEWEHGLTQGLGLRDWMVRIDNQMNWSLLEAAKRPVVRGREGWLYESGYLTSWTDLTAEEMLPILGKLYQLWLAQKVLREHGITMVLLVTPSKVETLPEHLPFPYRQMQAAGHVRLIDFLEAALDLGLVDHLDAQRLFWNWRDSEPTFPLFPRSGVHWGAMSSARVTGLLLEQLQRLSGVQVPQFDIASVRTGKAAELGQADLLELANVLDRSGVEEPIAMPEIAVRTGGHPPVGILVVASSFGWSLTEFLKDPAIAQPLSMYYYFKSRHDWIAGQQQEGRELPPDPAALRADLLRYRFVIVECNVTWVRDIGFGFPAAVLAAFGQPQDPALPPLSEDKLHSLIGMAGRLPH
jgi:hypothetical protein